MIDDDIKKRSLLQREKKIKARDVQPEMGPLAMRMMEREKYRVIERRREDSMRTRGISGQRAAKREGQDGPAVERRLRTREKRGWWVKKVGLRASVRRDVRDKQGCERRVWKGERERERGGQARGEKEWQTKMSLGQEKERELKLGDVARGVSVEG